MIYANLMFLTCVSLAVGQNLVLIGGNLRNNNLPVWNMMVELAGGPGVARIGVISASNSNTTEGDRVINNFVRLYGANAIEIAVNESLANNILVANLVQKQTGIFIVEDSEDKAANFWDRFTSLVRPNDTPVRPPNDVVCYESASYKRQNLIDTLRPSGMDSLVLTAIRKVLNNGGMVAGNAAVMSKSAVILGGDSVAALLTGTLFISSPRVPFSFRKAGGLALIDTDYVFDSQLSEKGREVRLIRTLLDSNVSRGLGIDENTAVIVSNPLLQPVGKVLTEMGTTSGAFYVDVSNVPVGAGAAASYDNVDFSFFTVDDSFDFTAGKAIYPTWKKEIFGQEQFNKAVPSDDILSLALPAQWRQTAVGLINSNEMSVTSHSAPSIVPLIPGVQVVFDRTRAVGLRARLPGNSNASVVSFQGMSASIKVLRILD
ncbi:Uncharacterized protein APZ42_021629 [Daphnia magna]|uniref:Uncharacterized protein n=1 Tax=Daphnia magna TaxID=35525 RepID=A0A0P5FQN7_9CRUS|nr:Uncharacterized protein APZ42_021629 [Daphnia magna]